MYTLVKQLITEKYLNRQLQIIENLVKHDRLTAKELAELVSASERTIFNDLQDIRHNLPADWDLEADGQQGLHLSPNQAGNTSEIWQLYMQKSLGIQVVKQLLFSRQVAVPQFIHHQGLSYESLKRETKKINASIQAYQIQIELTPQSMSWQGDESSVRIFYHRLLLPFTHTNFFFNDYAIQQANYDRFLNRLERKQLGVQNEVILGTCWFYINIIRQRAQAMIEAFTYDPEDPLYQLYHQDLIQLYGYEGIQLADDELFFAFFCFMDSWNYTVDEQFKQLLRTHYSVLLEKSRLFVHSLSEHYQLPALNNSQLTENITLFLIKYFESRRLLDKFLMEYHDVLVVVQAKFPQLYQWVQEEMRNYRFAGILKASEYANSTAVLLIQTAIYQVAPQKIKAYLVFQGEPAWKSFLAQELQATLGPRVELTTANPDQIQAHDLIIANYTFQPTSPAKIYYVSMVPTPKELDTLRQTIRYLYL